MSGAPLGSAGAEPLSGRNPVATPDQRDLEGLALGLLDHKETERARMMVSILWRNAVAWPLREQMDEFDWALREYLFYHALRAANSDPQRPRVLRIMATPGHWFGRDVPGSRWGGDSPDFIYRMMPVARGRRYVLEGRVTCAEAPLATFSLMTGTTVPVTLGLLDSVDMAIGADGRFTITLDDEPANGRPHHIQLKPDSDHLLVRDAIGDWVAQTPNQLAIHALDAPELPPPDEAEYARRMSRSALDSFYYSFYCSQSGSGQAPNDIRSPSSSAAFGGMPTQWGTKSNIELDEDEALIVTASASQARFTDATLVSPFFLSLDYWRATSSLNMTQMRADADGSFTYVIAHRDPGVHNWLDTGGRRKTVFGHRWQAFPPGVTPSAPQIATRKVRFSDLASELSAGVLRIDAAQRAAQLAARAEGIALRFLDH